RICGACAPLRSQCLSQRRSHSPRRGLAHGTTLTFDKSWPGLSRPSTPCFFFISARKTWMPGTRLVPSARRHENPFAVPTFSNKRSVRIEWGDCDPAGIIFYPRYFEIFDASTAMLFERALGMTKFQMFRNFKFSGFPLVRTRARFLKPTRFGDDVTVDSTIS